MVLAKTLDFDQKNKEQGNETGKHDKETKQGYETRKHNKETKQENKETKLVNKETKQGMRKHNKETRKRLTDLSRPSEFGFHFCFISFLRPCFFPLFPCFISENV